MFPVWVLHFRPNDLVLWRTRMGDGVDVLPIEREPTDELVRNFAKRLPLDLSGVQPGIGRIKDTELGLHGPQDSNNVVRVRFINERIGEFFWRDAQVRVAFIAEKVDVSGEFCAELVHFGLAVQFDIEALDVCYFSDVIEESLAVVHPPKGSQGRVNALRQQSSTVHVQNPKLRVFSALGREAHDHVFSVPRWENALDGRDHTGFIGVWIEKLFLRAIPSLAKAEFAYVLAAQGLLVEDPAIFIGD